MAIRTTPDLVKGIMTGIKTRDDLTPFIATANGLVNDECLNSSYDSVKLELIERWLSAHFYAMNKRRTKTQSVGGAVTQTADDPRFDLGLTNTTYGQTAISIDTDGNLAALNNSQQTVTKQLPAGKAGVLWLGCGPSNGWGCR